MPTESPTGITRRHGIHPKHNGVNDSLSTGSKWHPQSSRRRLSTQLVAVAAVSFLVGMAFTHPAKTVKQPMAIERGFEPPKTEVRRSSGSVDHIHRVSNNHADRKNGNQPHRTHKSQPRIIGLHFQNSKAVSYQISSRAISFSEDSTPEGYVIQPNWYQSNAMHFMDGHDFNTCIPMEEWQLESFIDCNKFHEIDWKAMRMINHGGSRIAFELTQSLPNTKHPFKFVYKTMRYGKDIDAYQIEQQRKDSLVMERTTSSKFIPDIHGYCSLAVMMDFMPEGNMHDYIKGSRILSRKFNGAHGVEDTSGKLLKAVDRLRVAIHIATSVADLHSIDGTKQPSYFHNDLCCHQYLFQDGIFKLNDFNYARPIYMNKKTHESCTRENYGMLHWKGRSLEEHIKVLRLPFDPPVPDKIDVWMMGNVIYYILTDLYTFEQPENLNNQQVGHLLVEGKRSPYPEYIEKSSDPSHIAIKKALDMCWVQNWRERPSAREISDFMMQELRTIVGEEEPDLRVVLPERDPNQTPSDGEFNAFND